MRILSPEIRVAVVFGPGMKIKPVWFDLNRKQHTILQITNSWRDKKGETAFIHFLVTDESALYELVYNMADTSWRLEQIEAL
ncbi:MAG: hypothetical protein ACYDG4_09765 [Desulfuromonadaceae bacterium]